MTRWLGTEILLACAAATGLFVATGCGTTGEHTGDPAANLHAPAYASCEDMAKVFDLRDENQLSYLPDQHWLIVSPSSTTYRIDLIHDSACVAAHPALARFVAQFKATQEHDQRGECRGALDQLATGTFSSGGKTADPEAVRDYAESLCEPLGIEVP